MILEIDKTDFGILKAGPERDKLKQEWEHHKRLFAQFVVKAVCVAILGLGLMAPVVLFPDIGAVLSVLVFLVSCAVLSAACWLAFKADQHKDKANEIYDRSHAEFVFVRTSEGDRIGLNKLLGNT